LGQFEVRPGRQLVLTIFLCGFYDNRDELIKKINEIDLGDVVDFYFAVSLSLDLKL
jgi:hypothetical protein